MTDRPDDRPAAFGWLPLAAGLWFLGWSGQGVAFSWIALDAVSASPGLLGALQTALVLPGPILAIAGGAAADRMSRRTLAVALHVTMGMLAAALAVALVSGIVTAPLLLAYAIAAGAASGAAMTVRAALLADVAGSDMLRAVTLVTVAQSAAQVLGPLAAASASWMGTAPALALLSACFLAGAVALRHLEPSRVRHARRKAPILSDLVAGWHETSGSPALRTALVASTVHAFGTIGPLHVLLPVLARDEYRAGIGWLGSMSALVPAGIVAGSLAALRTRSFRKELMSPMLAGLGASGAAVALLSFQLPTAVLATTVFTWGLAASVFFNTNRTLVQSSVRDDRRGRVLAVQAVGPMVAGAASTFVAGAVASIAGAFAACALLGAATMAAAAVLAMRATRTRDQGTGGRRGSG